MKYIIVDWAGNRMFPTLEFDSFEEGWEHIYQEIDNSKFEESQNEDDNEYQDYFVIPKK